MKFLTRNILKKQDLSIQEVINNLPNIKREKRLPKILSKEEIEKMIFSTKNLNHRVIIQIGYAAGLKVSEIINLRWEDIDFKREIIHLRQTKGKKDRIIMLSKKVKETLSNLDAEKKRTNIKNKQK